MDRFYSAETKKTYQVYPEGYNGSKYTSNLKAYVNLLYYQSRAPHEKIISLLAEIGVPLSKGALASLLNDQPVVLSEELLGARQSAIQKSPSFLLMKQNTVLTVKVFILLEFLIIILRCFQLSLQSQNSVL